MVDIVCFGHVLSAYTLFSTPFLHSLILSSLPDPFCYNYLLMLLFVVYRLARLNNPFARQNYTFIRGINITGFLLVKRIFGL